VLAWNLRKKAKQEAVKAERREARRRRKSWLATCFDKIAFLDYMAVTDRQGVFFEAVVNLGKKESGPEPSQGRPQIG
jgi:hypothetical protein